jgi:ABC-type bacteriocin/lantibiotic exporter with double-glycine peptidase domain
MSEALLIVIHNLFEKKEVGRDSDYSELLPVFIKENISKRAFVVGSLLFASIFSLVCCFDYLWEEELKVKGENYAKNLLLNKFRRLPFQEKQSKKDEIGVLTEVDSANFGWYWEHLINHVYHSGLSIILSLTFNLRKITEMGFSSCLFSLFWLILINAVSYYFSKLVIRQEIEYREKLTHEQEIRNKEINKAILIESMGLSDEYRQQQHQITKKNQDLLLSFNRIRSLNKTIPSDLLVVIFPFILLFITDNFLGTNLFILWTIYENSAEVFKCLWDYSDYASSQKRINEFLCLPEKNDNLINGKLLEKQEIKSIKFQNVSFRYSDQTEWVLRNYTHAFVEGRVNYLLGENGTGKSTILYLLLGVIKPQEGQIIIETSSENAYDLPSEVNLQNWRKRTVTYCSHDNLVDKGSTGQKQLANINQTLVQKQTAQVFLFDEADNALDEDNKKNLQKKIQELCQKKIVIYVAH